MAHFDEQLGRVLAELEKSGRADNTIIIFTADHGLSVGHHGFMGKQNMYDAAIRVPFLISGPGIPKDKKIDTPIYLQDVFPTSLELASITVPSYVDFKSVIPLISNPKAPHYPAIFGGYLKLQRMITKDGWKLIHYPRAKVFRLYNLKADPMEMNDLAKDPTQNQKLTALKSDLIALEKELTDPILNPKTPKT